MPTLEQLPVIALGLRRQAEAARILGEAAASKVWPRMRKKWVGGVPRGPHSMRVCVGRMKDSRGYFESMCHLVAEAERLERQASPDAFPSLLGVSASHYDMLAL